MQHVCFQGMQDRCIEFVTSPSVLSRVMYCNSRSVCLMNVLRDYINVLNYMPLPVLYS